MENAFWLWAIPGSPEPGRHPLVQIQIQPQQDQKTIQEQALERVIHSSYEAELGHIRQLFKNYRLFYQKVKKLRPNIEIYNATPNSFLDVFPFVDFSTIDLKHHDTN